MCAHGEEQENQAGGWTRWPRGCPWVSGSPLPTVGPQPHQGEGPLLTTDRDDSGAAVFQVQEQGHHALVHLGSQAAELLACH